MARDKGRFATNIGFVLSGIGAAVGLGSFWRFPQLTTQNGGGAFVFVFILMLLVFGIPLLWAEFAIGQRAQSSSVKAFEAIAGRRWRWVGFSFLAVSFTVQGYYLVLAGYVLRYALFSFGSSLEEDPARFLSEAVTGVDAALFGILVAAMTAGIVAFGVSKGLEKANLIMMPALFLMLVGLMFYAQFQPDADQGRDFYLTIDWSEIRPATFQAAIGQVFFAVGIGFGIMLTYASYVARGRSLLASSTMINASILFVGLFAGLMIFPLVFSQGLQERVMDPNAGSVSTLMLTMPYTFVSIGGFLGDALMCVFFLMLLFAAVSSTISTQEVMVAFLRDNASWARGRANVVAAEWSFLPGVLAAASAAVFAWLDTFLGGVLLFVAVFGLCLSYTFAIKNPVELLLGRVKRPSRLQQRAAKVTAVITAYVAPAALVIIFVLALPTTIRSLFGG